MKPLKVFSQLIDRAKLAAKLGMQFGGKRDLYAVFGYKTQLTLDDYEAKYARQNIARRIVDAPPAATWRTPPKINFPGTGNKEEKFVKAWDRLARKHRIWATFEKADRLAGLGNYSIMLLGFSDGADFKNPVSSSKTNELLYVQAYSQTYVEILSVETDTSNPRFGLPTMYRIKVRDPLQGICTGAGKSSIISTALDVHYSRVVHVAEEATDNNIVGTPRLQSVYDLFDDLAKVVGGTAETYWLTANKGMQIDVDKEAELSSEDEAALTDEIEEYQHQLRRFIRTRGVKINDLGSAVPDPKNTFEMLIALISGAKGIPKRILLGSEIGQLASDQDRANWADRIKERRNAFAEPCMLLPFLERCINAGILPEIELEDVEFLWSSTFQLTPLEESQSQAQKARATINLSKHFAEEPLMTKSEARTIIGLPAEPPEALPAPTVKQTAPSVDPAAETDPEGTAQDEGQTAADSNATNSEAP